MAVAASDSADLHNESEMLIAMLVEEHRRHSALTNGFAGLERLCQQQFAALRARICLVCPAYERTYASRMRLIEGQFANLLDRSKHSRHSLHCDRAELIFDLQRLFLDLERDLA